MATVELAEKERVIIMALMLMAVISEPPEEAVPLEAVADTVL